MINVERLCTFLAAIDAAIAGDRTRLARFMRDHEPLTVAENRKLADFIEGKLDRKRGRPPKRLSHKGNMLLQVAAHEVEDLKNEWRKSGRRYRIHGPAVDEVAARREITPDKLANFIRRSKPARNNR
jgi:hypothetical protein